MSGASVSYTAYRFTPPAIINYEQYWDLKSQWRKNPELDLSPQLAKSTKQELIGFAGMIILCIIISCIAVGIMAFIGEKGIGWIFSLIAIAGGLGVLATLRSMFSYFIFLSKFNHYYNTLKDYVIKSETYAEFVEAFEPVFY